jgi:hypothetical protein
VTLAVGLNTTWIEALEFGLSSKGNGLASTANCGMLLVIRRMDALWRPLLVIETVAAEVVVLTWTEPKLIPEGLRLTLAVAESGRNAESAIKEKADHHVEDVGRIALTHFFLVPER